jgi:hypothetical protein
MQLFKLHRQSRGRPLSVKPAQLRQQPQSQNVLQALYVMQRINQAQYHAGIAFKQLAINVYSHMGGPVITSETQHRNPVKIGPDQSQTWKQLLAHITELHGRRQIDILVASLIENQPPPGILSDIGLDRAAIKVFCSTLDTVTQVLARLELRD